MRLPALARALLVAAAASTGLACQVEVPLDLELVGDNTLTITVPGFPPELGEAQTVLTGFVQSTLVVDLFDILSLGGIPASIQIDDLLIAGEELIVFGGLINAGNVCITQDPDLVGGGMAFVRLLKGEADFLLDLATLVEITNEQLAAQLGGEPLPFGALIDVTVPISIGDLIGLVFGGGGGGGLELTQELSDVLPPDLPLLGGATIEAMLTFASSSGVPTSEALDACIAFLSEP